MTPTLTTDPNPPPNQLLTECVDRDKLYGATNGKQLWTNYGKSDILMFPTRYYKKTEEKLLKEVQKLRKKLNAGKQEKEKEEAAAERPAPAASTETEEEKKAKKERRKKSVLPRTCSNPNPNPNRNPYPNCNPYPYPNPGPSPNPNPKP